MHDLLSMGGTCECVCLMRLYVCVCGWTHAGEKTGSKNKHKGHLLV